LTIREPAGRSLPGDPFTLIQEAGMTLPIKWVGSIHKNSGRKGFRPEAVVVHIMEGTLAGTDSWFNDPRSKVSTHYGIGRNGQIHQYVGESDTAFHVGRRSNPTWKRIKSANPNLYTIGIEHEGKANSEWPDAMYQASAALIRDVCTRWSIPIDRDHVIGHREIYDRKSCPGHVVDLDRLVKMARQEALAEETYNLVKQSGKVRTRVALRRRRGAPTTAAPIVDTIPAGKELSYVGWTSNGTSVNANPHWYRDRDGNYFWAGGTDRPVPGIG
jgi:N-acetylmuramoyl-L-alanine amidase